ncbi:MAG: LacI family transcriptional regulator [Propionibacteriaceae bacterium]|nr:LacI family transcriptional regulator [Propionibacteriaceae bacterium]
MADSTGNDNGTLRQIAERAGVHVSTVSRVLRREEPAGGWSAAALRVLAVAQEMGYRPNLVASSLRTRRSRTIGLVMPRLTDFVVSAICQAIESAARYSGYHAMLTTPPDDMGAQMESVDYLLSRQVEGIIVTSLHRDDTVFSYRMAHLPVPVVATNRHVGPEIPAVVGDDFNGGYLATEYLLKLGHSRIGIVAGPRHASTAYDRLLGYRKALADQAKPIDEALIIHTDFEAEGGVVGTHSLLSLADPPTAIFAVNDTAAIGVMGAARQRGLSIPNDLSLVGYNDIPIVAQLPIPLTTIHSDLNNMGAAAVQSLLAAIDSGKPQAKVLPVSLVVRSSATAHA